MTLTIAMIREELGTREHWSAALVLLDVMLEAAQQDAEYADNVQSWLSSSGEHSTIFLRDTLCEPLRLSPRVVQAGEHFNATTEWHNTWIPIDTAVHRLRTGQSEVVDHEALRAIPGFGAF